MFGSTSLSNIFHSYWKQLYVYITNACKWSYLLRSRMFGGRIFLVGFKCCRSVSKVRQWANKLKPSDDILSKHLQTFIWLPQFSWKQLLLRSRHSSGVDSCFCSASKLHDHNFCFFFKWFQITHRMSPPTGKYSKSWFKLSFKAFFSAALGPNWSLFLMLRNGQNTTVLMMKSKS